MRFLTRAIIIIEPVLDGLNLVATLLAGVSGAFLTYDFSSLEGKYPNWARPLEILSSYVPFVLVFSTITILIVGLFKIFFGRTTRNLAEELKKEQTKNQIIGTNIQALFDGYLFHLSKRLNFQSVNGFSDRVNLYVCDSSGKFIRCGRFSTNPEFSKPGRTEYPRNEGCIAEGWTKGWHFDNHFGQSEIEFKGICNQKYRMAPQVSMGLKMKSRMYGVKRIDINNKSLAVLVVESTNSQKYDESTLKGLLENEEAYLGEFINRLWDYIPLPENARKRGL